MDSRYAALERANRGWAENSRKEPIEMFGYQAHWIVGRESAAVNEGSRRLTGSLVEGRKCDSIE